MTDAPPEKDLLAELMFDRLVPPREALAKLVALGYAGDRAAIAAAQEVDLWHARSGYALEVLRERLRSAEARAREAERQRDEVVAEVEG
jgi:hypothetical protein